jgi:hypothetical protein
MQSLFLPLLFAAFWVITSLLSGLVTGWLSLAKRFRTNSTPRDEKRISNYILDQVFWRLASRDPFVRLIATSDALYVKHFVLFRLFHPPLRIPWSEIQMEPALFGEELRLILGKSERVPLTLRASTALKLGLLEAVPASGFEALSNESVERITKKFKFK